MAKGKEMTNIKELSELLKGIAESTGAQYSSLSFSDSNGWNFTMSVSNTKET